MILPPSFRSGNAPPPLRERAKSNVRDHGMGLGTIGEEGGGGGGGPPRAGGGRGAGGANLEVGDVHTRRIQRQIRTANRVSTRLGGRARAPMAGHRKRLGNLNAGSRMTGKSSFKAKWGGSPMKRTLSIAVGTGSKNEYVVYPCLSIVHGKGPECFSSVWVYR